jgi:trehalose-phosphatase
VVIASGRWTRDLVPLLGLRYSPEIWGSHGWERLQVDGAYETAKLKQEALNSLLDTHDWVGKVESLGARCERKPAAVAIHWRGLENAQIVEIRNRVFEHWRESKAVHQLGWHDFDGGIELRADGRNKGDVVRVLFEENGPQAAYAYLGDDLTDENAFKALPRTGLSVLVRSQFRPTAANVWIRPPDELIEFLQRWHEVDKA